MINLMPPIAKKEVAAARRNTILFRYVILTGIAFGFLLVCLGVTYVYLSSAGSQADTTKRDNEAKVAGYAKVQADATALRSDIASAKQLFSEELRYSLALTRFSALLPNGTAVAGLEFNEQSFGTPRTFIVYITGKQAAEELRSSMQSSPYMTNVSLGNLATVTASEGTPPYPYTIELTATVNKRIAQEETLPTSRGTQ